MSELIWSFEEEFPENVPACNGCPAFTKCMRGSGWNTPLFCVHESRQLPRDFLVPDPVISGHNDMVRSYSLALIAICIFIGLLIYLTKQFYACCCGARRRRARNNRFPLEAMIRHMNQGDVEAGVINRGASTSTAGTGV